MRPSYLISIHKCQALCIGIDNNLSRAVYLHTQYLGGEHVEQEVLYGSLHGTGTKLGVVARLGNIVYRLFGKSQAYIVGGQHTAHAVDL